METVYKYFRWLSLDVVLGAIFFLAYLEHYYHVYLSLSIYFALASAIWLIYTADHLIDTGKVDNPSTERHKFHRQYREVLFMISGFILIISLVNCYYLPVEVIRNGALLAAGCITYLMLVFIFKKLWVKEMVVAVFYGIGIFLAPVTAKGSIRIEDVLPMSELVGLAFLNLMIFSYFDAEKDAKDGFNSLTLQIGTRGSSMLIHLTALLLISGSFLLFLYSLATIHLLFFSMALVLYSIHLLPVFYSKNERFRTTGDGVFYLPIIFLLLSLL